MIYIEEKSPVAIIGKKYSDIIKGPISKYCKTIIEMPDNPLTDSRLSGHIDLTMLKTGPDEVMLPCNLKGSEIESILNYSGIRTIYTDKEQGSIYPDDVPVNVCVSNDFIIYNPDTADEKIKEIFRDRMQIKVKQGYTGCSVCNVGKNSIITSDSGIHYSASKAGINSLLIKPGYIDLNGYDYGFIGGASFLINGKLFFTGTLKEHPSWKEIELFIEKMNISYENLTDKRAFDIGGALIFD